MFVFAVRLSCDSTCVRQESNKEWGSSSPSGGVGLEWELGSGGEGLPVSPEPAGTFRTRCMMSGSAVAVVAKEVFIPRDLPTASSPSERRRISFDTSAGQPKSRPGYVARTPDVACLEFHSALDRLELAVLGVELLWRERWSGWNSWRTLGKLAYDRRDRREVVEGKGTEFSSVRAPSVFRRRRGGYVLGYRFES